MRSHSDPLYDIFEQHLYNALVENESTEDFLNRVVSDYLDRFTEGAVIPHEHRPSIEGDLREEVLEMLRKKTYGHYNLAEFRRSQAGGGATSTHQSQGHHAPSSSSSSSSSPEEAARTLKSEQQRQRRRSS